MYTRTFHLENRENTILKLKFILKLQFFQLCAQYLTESFSLNTIVYFNKLDLDYLKDLFQPNDSMVSSSKMIFCIIFKKYTTFPLKLWVD